MKKITTIALLLFTSLHIIAQQDTSLSKKFLNEDLVLDINYYSWLNYPQNISLKNNCTEVNITSYFLITGKEKNISLALGGNIDAVNIYGDFFITKDSTNKATLQTIGDSIEYTKNKLTVAYIGFPVEIRFKTNNNIRKKNFKFTLGANIGYALTAYRKYKGKNFFDNSSNKIKIKLYEQPGINNLLGSVYLKIFYDKFGINFRYNLTPFFDGVTEDIAKINSYSVGLSIIVF
jgi:hypothetical protein